MSESEKLRQIKKVKTILNLDGLRSFIYVETRSFELT
jgi:hypothetical protein